MTSYSACDLYYIKKRNSKCLDAIKDHTSFAYHSLNTFGHTEGMGGLHELQNSPGRIGLILLAHAQATAI